MEGFNLFNRTNFTGINNIVGSLPRTERDVLETMTARGVAGRAPTQALGFTSAATARTFQFGARFNF